MNRRRRGNESLIFSKSVGSYLIRDSLPRLLRFMVPMRDHKTVELSLT